MQFKIVRSKRKTICVTVSPQNDITVRCPNGISERVINEFLESRKSWIENVVNRNSQKLAENFNVKEYKEIFVAGKKLPLIISGVDKITSSAVYVKTLKNIKRLFISEFSSEFINYVNKLSVQINLSAANIDFRKYKSRWGCCDSKKNITFNYILFMLPKTLQRYVVVHELCHTVYMNHSADFWRLVEKYDPNYRLERKQLKNYDFLTALY